MSDTLDTRILAAMRNLENGSLRKARVISAFCAAQLFHSMQMRGATQWRASDYSQCTLGPATLDSGERAAIRLITRAHIAAYYPSPGPLASELTPLVRLARVYVIALRKGHVQ